MSLIMSDSEKMAAVKRAVMRVKPEYFAWSTERQEQYRLTIPDADLFRIRQLLLEALFHISVKTEDEMSEVFDAFDNEQYLIADGAWEEMQ